MDRGQVAVAHLALLLCCLLSLTEKSKQTREQSDQFAIKVAVLAILALR